MLKLVTLICLLLLAVIQFRLWWGENGLLEYFELRQQVALQAEENDQLRKRNQRLDAQVQDLKDGLQAVEERARYDLGMIGQTERFYWLIGEPPRVFQLPDDTASEAGASR